MATANDLIDAALRRISRLGAGDSATSTEQVNGLAELNRMIAGWNAEMGPIFSETTESLSWTSGNASRTIGVQGDFLTSRPQQILEASITVSGTDYPLNLITHEAYQALTDKTVTSAIPYSLAYNPTFSGINGVGTLFMYPVPSATVSLRLTSLKPLDDLVGAANVVLPPGYEDAIVLNLAVRFADGEYGSDISPGLREAAVDAKVKLIRLNDITQEMMPDYLAPGLRQAGDYVNRWTV